MSVQTFLAHLHERGAKFRCSPAGVDSNAILDVKIGHVLGARPTLAHLKKLRTLLGSYASEIEEFYSVHNGCELYVQSPENIGLLFYPIVDWNKATKRFHKELMDCGRDPNELYDFEKYGVIFGEPAFSGNYFFLHNGAVHYSDHDGGNDTLLAKSFGHFLRRLARNPAKLLYDLGCYARYSDGKTETQWIPQKYFSEGRRSSKRVERTKKSRSS